MPCCSFLFGRAVTIRRKKFLLEEVGGLFEGPDRLFEKFRHILEKLTRILENPVYIRTSERHIRKKPDLLEDSTRHNSLAHFKSLLTNAYTQNIVK